MDDTIIPERPSFLDRVSGDTAPRRTRRNQTWRPTPAAKKAAQRDAKKREREAARQTVLEAIRAGAETFQAITKATGLDPSYIHSALRFGLRQRRRGSLTKVDRRYFAVR